MISEANFMTTAKQNAKKYEELLVNVSFQFDNRKCV